MFSTLFWAVAAASISLVLSCHFPGHAPQVASCPKARGNVLRRCATQFCTVRRNGSVLKRRTSYNAGLFEEQLKRTAAGNYKVNPSGIMWTSRWCGANPRCNVASQAMFAGGRLQAVATKLPDGSIFRINHDGKMFHNCRPAHALPHPVFKRKMFRLSPCPGPTTKKVMRRTCVAFCKKSEQRKFVNEKKIVSERICVKRCKKSEQRRWVKYTKVLKLKRCIRHCGKNPRRRVTTWRTVRRLVCTAWCNGIRRICRRVFQDSGRDGDGGDGGGDFEEVPHEEAISQTEKVFDDVVQEPDHVDGIHSFDKRLYHKLDKRQWRQQCSSQRIAPRRQWRNQRVASHRWVPLKPVMQDYTKKVPAGKWVNWPPEFIIRNRTITVGTWKTFKPQFAPRPATVVVPAKKCPGWRDRIIGWEDNYFICGCDSYFITTIRHDFATHKNFLQKGARTNDFWHRSYACARTMNAQSSCGICAKGDHGKLHRALMVNPADNMFQCRRPGACNCRGGHCAPAMKKLHHLIQQRNNLRRRLNPPSRGSRQRFVPHPPVSSQQKLGFTLTKRNWWNTAQQELDSNGWEGTDENGWAHVNEDNVGGDAWGGAPAPTPAPRKANCSRFNRSIQKVSAEIKSLNLKLKSKARATRRQPPPPAPARKVHHASKTSVRTGFQIDSDFMDLLHGDSSGPKHHEPQPAPKIDHDWGNSKWMGVKAGGADDWVGGKDTSFGVDLSWLGGGAKGGAKGGFAKGGNPLADDLSWLGRKK